MKIRAACRRLRFPARVNCESRHCRADPAIQPKKRLFELFDKWPGQKGVHARLRRAICPAMTLWGSLMAHWSSINRFTIISVLMLFAFPTLAQSGAAFHGGMAFPQFLAQLKQDAAAAGVS